MLHGKILHRFVFFFLLAAALGSAARAQVALDPSPPSRAQVLQLMAAMGVQQRVDASLKNAQQKVREAARTAFHKNYPDAAPALLKKIDAVFDSTPVFNFDEISEPLIAAYEKNLSAVDVQAGIDFYTSEAGRHLLDKLPAIQRETNSSGGALISQKLAAYTEEIERKLAEVREEAERQQPKPADASKNDASKGPEDKSK
jgi:hypothetical protein